MRKQGRRSARWADGTVGQGQPAYHSDARIQHRVCGISPSARGHVALPEAERGVAPKRGTCADPTSIAFTPTIRNQLATSKLAC